MASLPNSKTVTYDEWLRLPEVTDATEEVVNGEMRFTPPAKLKQALIVAHLNRAFQGQFDETRTVVLTGSFGVVIRKAPLTSRVPDLAVFERSTIVEQDGYIHSAPQLLIEVLSPANTRRDLEVKLADYASIAAPEVWVISPEARTVEVLQFHDGFLHSVRILAQGALTPKLFPQVAVDIATIWPD